MATFYAQKKQDFDDAIPIYVDSADLHPVTSPYSVTNPMEVYVTTSSLPLHQNRPATSITSDDGHEEYSHAMPYYKQPVIPEQDSKRENTYSTYDEDDIYSAVKDNTVPTETPRQRTSHLRRRKTARDVQVMKSQVRKEKSLLRSKLLSRENSVTEGDASTENAPCARIVSELLVKQQESFATEMEKLKQQMDKAFSRQQESYDAKVEYLQQQVEALKLLRKRTTEEFPHAPHEESVYNDMLEGSVIAEDVYDTILHSEESEDDSDHYLKPVSTSETTNEVPEEAPEEAEFTTLATAQFDYEPSQQDEMALREGDLITVVNMPVGGWWYGHCGNKHGMFPANYVQLVYDNAGLVREKH